MTSASIRILVLLCLGVVIMNTMKCYVQNLLTASQIDHNYQLKRSYDEDTTSLSSADKKVKNHSMVRWGGRYFPSNGTERHKVAIIVPYRDRKEHLNIFLNHMHPFLQSQQLEYGIFVIEQQGTLPFNRGKLMNVGFSEAGDWPCFIFHDVDLLPLDQRNIYSCAQQPRHLSAAIDELNYKLPYDDIFGGVTAFTQEQFMKVNGYSNRYWGWGGEDDDMAYRLKKVNYHIARYKMSIARYSMLDHKKTLSTPNPRAHALLLQATKTFKEDGLSSLKYVLLKMDPRHLYTRVLVDIDERESKDDIRISYYTNMLFGDRW